MTYLLLRITRKRAKIPSVGNREGGCRKGVELEQEPMVLANSSMKDNPLIRHGVARTYSPSS